MRFRILLAVPLAWALVFIVTDHFMQETAVYRVFLRTEIEAVKILALIGCLASALAFDRRDYMRRAWLFMGGCMFFLLLRDLTLLPAIEKALGPEELIRGIMVVLANVSVVIGIFMLSRAWRVAGLHLTGTKSMRWAGLLITLSLGLALGGPAVVSNFIKLFGGDAGALTYIASSLGDMISLVLIAPVFFTALSLSGGIFAWPWWLVTASLLSWLLYDAVIVVGPYLGLGEQAVQSFSEMMRAMACMFEFSAGLAQRHVVKHTREVSQA